MKKLPTIQQSQNLSKLSKPQLIKIVEEATLLTKNPEQYKEVVRKSVPEFVREMDNKEDVASAMFESAQQMMLSVVQVLQRYYHFKDEEVRYFNEHLTDILRGVEALEDGGLSILSPHSVGHVGALIEEIGVENLVAKVAEIRYQKNRTWRAGLDYPNSLQGSKIERRIQKPK